MERIVADFEGAELPEAQNAMLRYARKLTLTPKAVNAEDVEALRTNGWSDEAILSIAEVVGYYAYVNRLVFGLGIELEEG